MNFLSAFMGAFAVAEVFLLCKALRFRSAYALIACALLIVNPVFWWQSVIAEVYATTEAFFVALLVCLVLWRGSRNPKLLLVAGVLGCLCWGLHHSAVLVLLAVLIYLFLAKASKKDWGAALAGAGAGFVVAMIAYFGMASIHNTTTAVNSLAPSASAYGLKTEDFNSATTRVAFFMNAKQFAVQLSGASSAIASKNFGKYSDHAGAEFGWPGILLIVIGAGSMLGFKRWRCEGVLFVLSWALMFAFVLMYDAFDLEVDFLLGYVLLSIFVAAGLQGFQTALLRDRANLTAVRAASAVAAIVIVSLGILPVLSNALTALQEGKPDFLTGFNRQVPFPVDLPTYPHDFAGVILSHVEDNALIVTEWENEWPIYYIAQFEKNKPNIEAIETFPVGTNAVPAQSMIAYLKDASRKRPIYTTRPHQTLEPYFNFEEIIPGALYQLHPRFSE